MEDFPTQPLPDESNEAFAERKRKWARDNSERIRHQYSLDYPYLPEDYNPKIPMEDYKFDKPSL